MLAELRKAFLAELPLRLDEIEQLVLTLSQPDTFRENFETVYRHIHSLKGSAGTHGLHIISTICHNMEDTLNGVVSAGTHMDNETINNCLAYIDLLRKTLLQIKSSFDDYAEIERDLDKLRNRSISDNYHGLIVITSQLHKQICLSAFEEHPVSFTSVSNGYEALGRLLTERFDILITNMELPMLHGIALVGAVRLSSTINKRIPSVLLTSHPPKSLVRYTDPDYVVSKDSNMLVTVTSIANEIMNKLMADSSPH